MMSWIVDLNSSQREHQAREKECERESWPSWDGHEAGEVAWGFSGVGETDFMVELAPSAVEIMVSLT